MTIVNRFSKAQVLCILFILWTLISISEFQCISHFFTKVFMSSLSGHSLLWAGPQLLYQKWCAAGEEKFLIRVPSIEEFFKPFTFFILQNKLCKSLSEAKFLSRTPKLQPQHWWFPGKWCCYIPGFQVSKKRASQVFKALAVQPPELCSGRWRIHLSFRTFHLPPKSWWGFPPSRHLTASSSPGKAFPLSLWARVYVL